MLLSLSEPGRSRGIGTLIEFPAVVSDGVAYIGNFRGTVRAISMRFGHVSCTYGLDARTGRQLWSFPDGKYSPVVADRKRLYVVGYARMYGMVPR